MAASSSQDPAWFQELQAAIGAQGEEEERHVQSAIIESLQQIGLSDGIHEDAQASLSIFSPTRPIAPSSNIRFNRLFNFTFVYFSVRTTMSSTLHTDGALRLRA